MNALDLRDVPTAVQLRQALAAGQTSALDIAQRHIERIEALEPALHAWKYLDPDAVLQQARAQSGAAGLLAGIPVGVKDVFDLSLIHI